MQTKKLKPLFLFLTFEDLAASHHYVIEDSGTIIFLLLFTWVFSFILATVAWALLTAFGLLGFLAFYLGLTYAVLQLGHIYVYLRDRHV